MSAIATGGLGFIGSHVVELLVGRGLRVVVDNLSTGSTLDEAWRCGLHSPRKIDNPSENRRKFHVHEYMFEEYRSILEETFVVRALVLTQVDEIISTHHPDCAWNFVAVCYN